MLRLIGEQTSQAGMLLGLWPTGENSSLGD